MELLKPYSAGRNFLLLSALPTLTPIKIISQLGIQYARKLQRREEEREWGGTYS